MGTHPIFESDFDCLTDCQIENCKMSNADYLKKYLSDDKKDKEKKRKKKKVKGNIAIIDNDVNWDDLKAPEDEEDAPLVVNVVDSRSDTVKRKQDGWRKVGASARDKSPKRSIKKSSPPRRIRKDSSPSDSSPPRRKVTRKDSKSPQRRRRKDSSSASPPRRSRKDSDTSPPRRKIIDSDESPPRSKRVDSDDSPPRRRRRKDSDESPPRRTRVDSDTSPPRRTRKDSDASPPRRKRVDSDESPPRRKRVDSSSEDERSNPRQKMSDGTKSGLNTKSEFLAMKPKIGKNSNLQKIIDDAKNAETVYREKGTGKKRDFEKEEELDAAERARKEEELKNYKVWNKGKKQLEQKEENVQSYLKEIEKPLARYKDDKDFNDLQKAKMHQDDPMFEYMMSKNKTKTKKARQQSSKKMYTGSSTAPNRFGILPGYRWDGVDRSTGFENKLFTYHNEKRIQVNQAWRANTDDF